MYIIDIVVYFSDFNNRDETIQVVPSRILWLWSPRADHAWSPPVFGPRPHDDLLTEQVFGFVRLRFKRRLSLVLKSRFRKVKLHI